MYDFFEVCIGDKLEVTCKVNTFTLFWEINNDVDGFTTQSMEGSVKMVGGFKVTLVLNNQPLVSTATLNNIDPSHNGTVLTCINTIVDQPLPEQMANVTIIVQGKLIS